MRKPPAMRTMETIIVKMLRERVPPRMSLGRREMRTRQRRAMGMEITVGVLEGFGEIWWERGGGWLTEDIGEDVDECCGSEKVVLFVDGGVRGTFNWRTVVSFRVY